LPGVGISRKQLAGNLQRVRENIAAAAARTRRDPASIQLVAVTKAADLDDIKNLVELGVVDLGENRVQQLTARSDEVREWLARRRKEAPPPVRWHMIGHLQRNKVRDVIAPAQMIHSVDSLRLAEEISTRAGREGRVIDILLEVNCSLEPQKFGVAVGAAGHLAEQVATLPALRLLGLMTMAPFASDPEKARPTFVRLREMFEEMRDERIGGKDFRHLSMGMTQDYPVAVEEGATILRIGTALLA
jgi:pyridoxal phosphate enzyme (YggS family)